MTRLNLVQINFFVALIFSAIIAFMPVSSQAVNYAGKKVSIIVPTEEDGGSDRIARIFQPFYEKYLPGNPTVLVINKPGGASIMGGNWFEREAKRDGTALIVSGGSLLNSYLFGGKKVKFKLRQWRPIMLAPFGTCFYAHKSVGVKGKDSVADIKKLRKTKRLLTGAKSPNSSDLRVFIAYDLLGLTHVKPVYGVSSGRRRKAAIRGEMQLGVDSALKCRQKISKYVKKGTLNLYMSMGFINENGALVRDPMLDNVPHVAEVYEKVNGKKPSGQMWKAYMHFLNLNIMATKGFWLPTGTPDSIYNEHINTVKKIFKDKTFRKRTKKVFANYPQSFGKNAENIVKNALDFSPDTMTWVKGWIKRRMIGSN